MTLIRITVTLCFCGLLLGQEKTLTLQDALKAAIENNLDVQLEKINVHSSSLDLDGVLATYEPTITGDTSYRTSDKRPSNNLEGGADETFSESTEQLNLGFSKSENFGFGYSVDFQNRSDDSTSKSTFSGATYSSVLTVGFEQKLLKGFAFDPTIPRKDEYIAKTNMNISKLDLEARMISVIEETENAYWDLVQAMDDLSVKKNSLKLAQQLYEQNKVKIEVGTLAPIELVSAEATVASREADIVSAENALNAAADRLKKIMNLPPGEWTKSFAPSDEPEAQIKQLGLESALNKAFDNRVEMEKSRLQTENAQLEHRFNRNALLPELNLRGSYTHVGASIPVEVDGETLAASSWSNAVEQTFDGDLPGYSFQLLLTWTPFNKAAKVNAAKTEIALKQREVQEAQLRLTILEEVRGALRELESSEKSIQANEKARKFREENLKAEIQKFQNGLTTNYNVAQVQDELAQARSAEIASRISYRKALVSYYKAIGALLDERSIQTP